MTYHPEIHHRRSIRLREYDYSQSGAYFVTMCAQNRECLFGEITDGKMILNDAGRVVEQCWNDITIHFPHVELDEFVIMPNHVHGILIITDANVGAKNISPRPKNTKNRQDVGAKNFSPLPETSQQSSPPTTNQHPRGTSKTIGSVIRGFKIGVTKWMRQNTEFYHIWQRNYYERVIRDENELNRIREYIINNPIKWEMDRENPDNMDDTGAGT
ncbi:MAG: transposase [Calditrichaceae bacterium]